MKWILFLDEVDEGCKRKKRSQDVSRTWAHTAVRKELPSAERGSCIGPIVLQVAVGQTSADVR